MTTALTLGNLRAEIGYGIGEGRVVGTFSGVSTNFTAVDSIQFEPDNYYNNAWMQVTTPTNGAVVRVKTWTQLTSLYTFFNSFSVVATTNDPYEVHTKLSFDELRSAINDALTFAGKAIRQPVRDESNTLQAAVYQITPNYAGGSTNAFYPGGVEEVSYQYWTGEPTRDYVVIPKAQNGTGWYYLDDTTIQLPEWAVDGFAGNALRLSGYGPIATPITTNVPGQTIATFQDDFMAYVLKRACVYQAWLVLAGKVAGGERATAMQNAQLALQAYEQAIKNWKRPNRQGTEVIVPVGGGGWTGWR